MKLSDEQHHAKVRTQHLQRYSALEEILDKIKDSNLHIVRLNHRRKTALYDDDFYLSDQLGEEIAYYEDKVKQLELSYEKLKSER